MMIRPDSKGLAHDSLDSVTKHLAQFAEAEALAAEHDGRGSTGATLPAADVPGLALTVQIAQAQATLALVEELARLRETISGKNA